LSQALARAAERDQEGAKRVERGWDANRSTQREGVKFRRFSRLFRSFDFFLTLEEGTMREGWDGQE
jgi:hypothetical protein